MLLSTEDILDSWSRYTFRQFSKLLNPILILSSKLESEALSVINVHISINENSKSFDENLNARGVLDNWF
jgi:hypothetical protein